MFTNAINGMSKFLSKATLCTLLFAFLAPVANAAEDYKLGAGDTVRITVFENPDMTTETQVSEDGNVTFPLLGQVTLGGLSRSAAEAKLAGLLKKGGFVNQPQLNISILEYRSQQVSVLGQVNKPGKYAIDRPSTVLDLISLAGGVNETGADSITVIHNQDGKAVKHNINLVDLFQSANLADNIAVGNGDVIHVGRAPVFYIYGEVQRSGAYRLEPGMTVMQALSVGGGLSPRGTERGVKVSRRSDNGELHKIDVKLTDPLQENDVVHIKESLF
ncbi:MAG: polysaccharide export protein EpsE [Gammaproteobacteria bacterium]